MRSYLWSGSDMKTTGSKVAWEKVCLPYEEGGLGIRRVKEWNEAAIMKHVWNLAKVDRGNESLWCEWANENLMKNVSFWKIKMPTPPSWIWRCILNLRDATSKYIKYIVGDGKRISIWYDNWLSCGPIYKSDSFDNTTIYNSGLYEETKVEKLIRRGRWKWPMQNGEFKHLQQMCEQIALPGGSDDTVWTPTNGKFSIASAWEEIRARDNQVILKVQTPKKQWSDFVNWCVDWWGSDTKWNSKAKLYVSAMIYFIWHARNKKLFEGKKLKAKWTIEQIKLNVEARIKFCKLKD